MTALDSCRLFVYGTLRRGSQNKFARLLHAHAQFTGDARMRGRLYRLGSFPGAVPSSVDGEWIRGEVFIIDDPRWIVESLDDYEGSSFQRNKAEVKFDCGGTVDAWVYIYCGASKGPRIRSGDWLRP